jgi:hypothetical protein
VGDYLVQVVRGVVHDHIQISFLSLGIFGEKIVVDFYAAGVLEELDYFELSVGELRVLEDLLDGELPVGGLLDDFEDLAKGAFSDGLQPNEAVGLVLGLFKVLLLRLGLDKSLRVVLSGLLAHLQRNLNSRPFHDSGIIKNKIYK